MLVAIGVSHKTAPIEIREKLVFSPEVVDHALSDLVSQTGLEEVVLLSTCNRTEIYGKSLNFKVGHYELFQWWSNYHPELQAVDKSAYYQLSDSHVIRHLMRLACGLDSLALGETQILGQLKQAYQYSQQNGVMGKVLSQTFETIFQVAKKIRTQTEISKHPTSISYLSVLMAKRIFTDLNRTRVLLIGAGENIEQLIPHLKAQNIADITLLNRTFERGEALAKKYGLKVAHLQDLPKVMTHADIIISSTFSESPLINYDMILQTFKGQKHRPMLMIDLGVPRDIHPDVNQHQDVYLYSVDDLKAIADENKSYRIKAAQQAEKLIAYESCAFAAKLHALGRTQPIKEFRKNAEQIKQSVVEQAKRQLKNGQDPEKVIEELAHSLTNQILHEPTIRMRQALMDQDENKIKIYQHIFGEESV